MQRILLAAALCFLLATPAVAHRDRGSWNKTLQDKAQYFEENTAERHNIVGSYPSMVTLIPPKHYAGSQQGAWKQIVETGELPPGWVVDHGTGGVSNVAHTSSWTGCLLTSQAFRVAFVRDKYGEDSQEYKTAYERANEVIHSLRILTLVSGQPGFLARGVALGHGISYEERAGSGTRDLWSQGAGEFSHLRYRGGPSHHNYDHVFRGLGIYYFVAADEAQKASIREIVRDMSNWAHLNNNMIVMHPDGKRISTELIGGWRGLAGNDRPSGGSLMALAGLKISHAITGNEEVKELYDHWTDRLGLRDPEKTRDSIMGRPRSNYDDTDHLLGDLYLLNMIEEDEQLRDYYRKCVADSWEVHKQDRMAWFNYVYQAVLGDEYADPEGSLFFLQTHPTCRVLQPQMNSIRTDIEFFETDRGKEAKEPLPVHARPSDNEYAWKNSPYSLDRWLARTVSLWEVSPHDPYVQFAADTSGVVYYSDTNGEIWHKVDGLSQARDVVFSPDHPWMVFAATAGGVYRTLDGGRSWSRTLAEAAVRLKFDPQNSNVLYAVCDRGVYESADRGERDMGTQWRNISGETSESDAVYAVDVAGEQPTVFMLASSGVYRKSSGDREWQPFARETRRRGFSGVETVRGTPKWLRVDDQSSGRLFRALESRESRTGGITIEMSDDGGATWAPVLRELKVLSDWFQSVHESEPVSRDKLMELFQLRRQWPIEDLHVDRNNPDTWYGRMEDGVAVTTDAGNTWTVSRDGLDIPRVGAVWVPRHSEAIMVGTPAGMYVSRDGGQSWSDTTLIPQGDGAIRTEIGGIGYLTAYWMGRYHGFVDDNQATAEFWEN